MRISVGYGASMGHASRAGSFENTSVLLRIYRRALCIKLVRDIEAERAVSNEHWMLFVLSVTSTPFITSP
jgi:hypothetical protein